MNTYFKISIGDRLPCIIFFRLIYIRGLSLFYLIHYFSANVHVHPLKFSYLLYETINPHIKKGNAHNSIIMFPVNRLNMIKNTLDSLSFSHGVSNSALASYPACNSEGESDGTVVNTDCFSGYDPSILGNIDPDINYLNSDNNVKTLLY